MPETPTSVPRTLIAGDTWRWTRSLPDYPASDGWALSYELWMPQAPTLVVSATADGDDFAVLVPAATTAPYATGVYRWVERVSRSGERYTIAQGRLMVDAVTRESEAARMVRIIRAAIEELITGRAKEVRINSRAKVLNTLPELRAELGYWMARLEQEENPGRLGPQFAARMQMPGYPGAGFPLGGGQ